MSRLSLEEQLSRSPGSRRQEHSEGRTSPKPQPPTEDLEQGDGVSSEESNKGMRRVRVQPGQPKILNACGGCRLELPEHLAASLASEDIRNFAQRVDHVESQVTKQMQQTINLLDEMTNKHAEHGGILEQLQEANREVHARLDKLERGDGISHEAAKALLADIQWGGKLAYLLNDMFYTAHIPESIDRGITVLLPKIPCPLEWGDTRPITLSSTLLKWASQLLLARAGGHIRSGSLLQWARAGRQGVELVATIRRVTQMARDWGALFWLSILETRTLNVAIADSITTVPQTNGIRQGSPDSPDLFGAIVARDLQTAISQAPTQPRDPKGGPPPPRVGGSFLDDTYLWSQDRSHLQKVIHNLEGELARDGLHIHPIKTAILYSKPTGGGTFEIVGETVACSDYRTVISTLGSPITFHDQTAALIAEMSRRSRNAFRKHKQILTARTNIKSRAKAYLTLVRNAGVGQLERPLPPAGKTTPPQNRGAEMVLVCAQQNMAVVGTHGKGGT
ncbi:unnamed protein product [Symbiodinium necroappetens]|uniref:Reverse transcriptase domain-containing protein n=1 Tax=Symbiodinium necroappetens TaxID=1628268 RepID=A0A812XC53_9DINO|nr:unnamed protein product [Symbiodinium necroappetens]